MRHLVSAAALGVALTLGVAGWGVTARATEPTGPIKLQPDWLAEPSFLDRAKAYPEEALKQGASGRTQLSCTVEADGHLSACAVVSETPAGLGFGQASLSLASRFRMKPEAIHATGADAPRITIPIRWAMVTSPDWVRQPNGDNLVALYPRGALEAGVGGMARLRCQVTVEGLLSDCFVLSETPLGLGFGEATIKAARHFKMRPMIVDGRPLEGAVVEIPIHWDVGEGSRALGGQLGIVLTVLENGKGPTGGAKALPCPSAADAARKCQAHFVSWAESPTSALLGKVMDENKTDKGASRLICTAGEDGVLRDCTVSGTATPAEEAAMRALAAHLHPAPTTADGVTVTGAKVVVLFNWTELAMELKAARKRHP